MPKTVWELYLDARTNLQNVKQDIEDTKLKYAMLQDAMRTPLQRSIRAGKVEQIDQKAALDAAKAQATLAKANETAALSGMNHAQKVEYLRGVLASTQKGTLEYAQAQTRLNTTINQGSNGFSRITSLMSKMFISMVVWEGFRAVTQAIDEVIQKQKEYSLETARFAAMTDQSVSDATAAWNRYADIGISAGVKPSEMGGTMRTAQLAQGTQAEKDAYVEVISKLQSVTGEQADTISKSVYAVLEQSGQGLSGVSKIADQVIATLQKMPNIKIENVFSAMQEAPSLAKLWGTSFEDAFNIIVQGASRAQESPEQMATSFQRLSAGINDLSAGGENAYERISKLREVFEFDIAPGGTVLPILDVLKQAAEKLPDIPAAQQQEFLEALSGGSIRPEQMRNIIGGIDAFTIDLKRATDGVAGSLDEAANKVRDSWGHLAAELEAGMEKLKMTGDIGQNLGVNILSATVGKLGKQGTEFVNKQVKMTNVQNMFGTSGAIEKNKEEFIKSLTGMTPEEAKAAIEEYNSLVANAYNGAQRADPLNFSLSEVVNRGIVNGEEATALIAAQMGQKTGMGFIEGVKSVFSSVGDLASDLLSGQGVSSVDAGKDRASRSFPTGIRGKIGEEEATTAFRRDASGGMSGLTGESVLDRAGQLDLTKNTEEEIATARQIALDLARQDIQAQREFYESIGLTREEIDKIIEARQAEIDATITLVRTQQGLNYEIGAQGKYLDEAIRKQENAQKLNKPDFQFKRLKDFDPAQFGQLQALTQMYDKFLSNIGSPEKKQNINLLLGEQNVFKTMNGRMTALQMALEDLTKVEKAQLSGTWNMPAGATALVPISSLDIQRWNKADSGGLSAEALMALMNATSDSGDTVAQSQQMAATRIIEAIRESFTKGGLPMDKVEKAKTPGEAVKAVQETILDRVAEANAWKESVLEKARGIGQKPSETGTGDMESIMNLFKMVAQNVSRPTGIGGKGLVGGGGGDSPSLVGQKKGLQNASDLADAKAIPTVQVTVASTPIKATFNANLMVNLNGAIVARALVPILYSLLTKTTASTGQRPKGVQR